MLKIYNMKLSYASQFLKGCIGEKPWNTVVHLGPLRSRCQHGIRHTRGLLGKMPVKNKGGGLGTQKRLQAGVRSDACERKAGRQGWGGRALKCSAILRKCQPGQRLWAKAALCNSPTLAGMSWHYLCCARLLSGSSPGHGWPQGLGAAAESCQSVDSSVPTACSLEGDWVAHLSGHMPVDEIRLTFELCLCPQEILYSKQRLLKLPK